MLDEISISENHFKIFHIFGLEYENGHSFQIPMTNFEAYRLNISSSIKQRTYPRAPNGSQDKQCTIRVRTHLTPKYSHNFWDRAETLVISILRQ